MTTDDKEKLPKLSELIKNGDVVAGLVMSTNPLVKSMDPTDQCGIAPFNTGPDDPMIEACKFHDACYVANKDNDESVRRWCDDTFHKQMQGKGLRANLYYYLARFVGWIPWYFWRGKK